MQPLQNYNAKASDMESDDSEDIQGGRGRKFISPNRRASTYDPLFTSSPLHPNGNMSNIDIMRSIMARSMPCLSGKVTMCAHVVRMMRLENSSFEWWVYQRIWYCLIYQFMYLISIYNCILLIGFVLSINIPIIIM